MKSFVLPLLLGAGAGQGTGAPANPSSFITSLIPFAAIIAIFYFLIIRPQNKKQKETQRMLSALKKGDKITTIGGVHGTIVNVRESTVVVKVDDNVKIEFSRSAISGVVSVAREEKEEKQEDETKTASEDNASADDAK
jgi:preprotein translocase subunit YajC